MLCWPCPLSSQSMICDGTRMMWAIAIFICSVGGVLLSDGGGKCAVGEYWCQDRCGSDSLGDTCCETPDGQHNLCGVGTICCQYGCCPSGTTCNPVGGCDAVAISETDSSELTLSSAYTSWESSSVPATSVSTTVTTSRLCSTSPGECTQSTSIVQANTTITQTIINTAWLQVAYIIGCKPTESSISSSTYSSTTSTFLNSTSTVASTSITSSTLTTGSTSSSSTLITPTTFTESDGQTIISSGSVVVIGTDTVTLPSVTAPTTLTTHGETFTLSPSVTSSSSLTGGGATTWTGSSGQTIISSSGVVVIGSDTVTLPTVSSRTTFTTDGQTFTLTPPSGTTTSPSTGNGATTFTGSGGQTIISSSGVVIIGSDTVTLPSVTATSTLVTDGQTFTLTPSNEGTTTGQQPITTTAPDGQTIISSSGVVIIGTDTVTLPTVTSPSTFVTDGETFTLLPPSSSSSSSSSSLSSDSGPITTTASDGQTIISSSGVVIIGTDTVTLPTVTSPSTFVTDGETFTLLPPNQGTTTTSSSSSSTTERPITSTLPDGNTLTSSSGVIIIGTDTIPVPTGITIPVTLTTDGETLTFQPSPTSTSSTSSSSSGTLPIYATWPPGATVSPVPEGVDEPEPGDDGTRVQCRLWFFSLCISTPSLHIGGWNWNLPPGIYPPGPPPPGAIQWPPGFSLEGTLPPWPRITIPAGGTPEIPEGPEDDQCTTESASICGTTSSFGTSGSVTTTTQVGSTCATIHGCEVTDSATTSTTTGGCSTRTVTDIWVSCSASSCATTSTSLATGCSVTASTTTLSCTATATAGVGGRIRRADGQSCENVARMVIWPENGRDESQTDSINTQLQRLTDPNNIYTSTVQGFGVSYWTAPLSQRQVDDLREFEGVASIYAQCDDNCESYTTGLRYANADPALRYISQIKGLALGTMNKKNPNRVYYFDDSAGTDIPVYIVD
ncbi:hypothetical protein GGR52DRAFT_303474 [Hypoxylon sp. FL1284]|nr:hypothetical protein GGR52DRAFT_303474 [Hypoxylon sp. FL1284]